MAHSSAASVSRPWRAPWRQLMALLVFGVILYVVVPRLGDFKNSLTALKAARLELVLVALTCVVATFLVAALLYCVLAFRKLAYTRAVIVQGATGLTNRLLPAGLGGLGLNAAFLHRSRHTVAEATGVVVVNNLLGFVGHMALMIILIACGVVSRWPAWRIRITEHEWLIAFMVAVVVVVGTVVLRGKIASRVGRFLQPLVRFSTRWCALAEGLVCAMAITLLTATVFYLSLLAVGAHMSIGAAFVAFTMGVAVATVTPTPGGLGGAEAGLTAGLAGYGVAVDQALAAVLLYRLLTYWLPMVPGLALFGLVLRRKYAG